MSTDDGPGAGVMEDKYNLVVDRRWPQHRRQAWKNNADIFVAQGRLEQCCGSYAVPQREDNLES